MFKSSLVPTLTAVIVLEQEHKRIREVVDVHELAPRIASPQIVTWAPRLQLDAPSIPAMANER